MVPENLATREKAGRDGTRQNRLDTAWPSGAVNRFALSAGLGRRLNGIVWFVDRGVRIHQAVAGPVQYAVPVRRQGVWLPGPATYGVMAYLRQLPLTAPSDSRCRVQPWRVPSDDCLWSDICRVHRLACRLDPGQVARVVLLPKFAEECITVWWFLRKLGRSRSSLLASNTHGTTCGGYFLGETVEPRTILGKSHSPLCVQSLPS